MNGLWRTTSIALTAALLLAVVASVASPGAGASNGSRGAHGRVQLRLAAAAHGFVYPLKLSTNRRYLVDQRNVPFLIVGDSPQAMIGNLSLNDAAAYIADRKGRRLQLPVGRSAVREVHRLPG